MSDQEEVVRRTNHGLRLKMPSVRGLECEAFMILGNKRGGSKPGPLSVARAA
jgi:hypothetical protein